MTKRDSKRMVDNIENQVDVSATDPVARRLYDPEEDGSLAVEIVYAIADARDVAPTEIRSPTLYESVDSNSLQGALFDLNGWDSPASGSVQFHYAEYLVTVESDGWIEVYERPSNGSADESI